MSAAAAGLHMIPVQCQEDPFGFNALVVYGDTSYPLVRCTPFLSSYDSIEPVENNHGRYPSFQGVWSNAENYNNRAPTTRMQDEPDSRYHGQPNSTPCPALHEIVDAPQSRAPIHPRSTDGCSPVYVPVGGMGQYRSLEQDNLPEEDEKNKSPKKKKKKVTRKNGKKSRRIGRLGSSDQNVSVV